MQVLEPDRTQWVSLTVFAPRKNGSYGFCEDHGKPYSVILKDSYLHISDGRNFHLVRRRPNSIYIGLKNHC